MTKALKDVQYACKREWKCCIRVHCLSVVFHFRYLKFHKLHLLKNDLDDKKVAEYLQHTSIVHVKWR